MSINKSGLGDWWPRPDQAAVGGLDHLPADQWPMLTAKWHTAGFDSQSLRQLAQLQSGESPGRWPPSQLAAPSDAVECGSARADHPTGVARLQGRDWSAVHSGG
jgi:hypothetical protein